MYLELIDEGIDDVKFIGINGYQYIDDSLDCMICLENCTSSTCEEGPRVLPWTQDLDSDGIQYTQDYGDLWDEWDITLRDLLILDRNGLLVEKINLTYYNPDPNGNGECSGNYETIKNLILEARNR
ncbi:MAG: hypothetical protein CBD58_03655 [bacterium TMED198]|nr:MAG: hypothetical protein CBD58_03655 [bacterium TMED198]|tara:strand:+ start:54 stop:431 length:378 start_codon:yes stop_codon:yes gene_type:complete